MQLVKRNIINHNGQTYMPMSVAKKSILAYIFTICAVSVLHIEQILPIWLWIFGITSILLFFVGSNYLTKQWHNISSATYVKRLFLYSFLIRLIYVIFIYNFNWQHYDTFYESSVGDIMFYVPSAKTLSEQFTSGSWIEAIQLWLSWNVEISDMGYIIYLAIVYLVTGGLSEVIFPLILKALYGAITCVLIYRIAQRHFGEQVARMAGIFCMLQFTLIWWCGSMMKETEMILLATIYVNLVDKVLSKGSFKIKELLGAAIVGLLLYTFRAALSLVGFAALFLSLLLAKKEVVNTSKKVLVGIVMLFVFLVAYTQGMSNIMADAKDAVSDTSAQSVNMEWRTQREHGNSLAKYASATVFAPMIFTIPFPTMAYTFQEQEHIMMQSGGYFVKNVLSFFVILVFIMLLFSGKWREHVFPIAFMCGYLVALVFSNFAQSGRFHMPIMPLFMMFAAYGMSFMNIKRFDRWYNYVLVLEVIVCIAWAWFKLAGRGLA